MNNTEKQVSELEQEIKTLQFQIQFLKEEQEKILNGSNLSTLSYKDLMHYYVKYSPDWFEYDRKQHKDICLEPEIYTAWKAAYQVFKDKREARDEQIKTLVSKTVEQFKGQLIDIDSILILVATPIKTLYETITPFDCEDEKWLYPVDSGSWIIRIKKKVHSCIRDYTIEEGVIKPILRKKWVTDLRK